MSTKNKFRKEKYITQREYKNGWCFRVRYDGADKTFSEWDYLSASMAFKKAIEYRNSIVVGDFLPKKDVTVQECYDLIPEIYSLSDETMRKLDTFYNKYIHKKDSPLRYITRADVILDMNVMVTTCSNDTISRVLSIWKKIYGVAIAKDYISKDITINIKCPVSRKIKTTERNEETSEELLIKLGEHLSNRLKSSLAKNQAKNILLLLLYTGMRPSELLALDNADVDMKKKTIRINKRMSSSRKEKDLVVPAKTNESNRTIPIPKKALPILKDIVTDGILFPNDEGKHWYTTDLESLYHKYATEIGIDFHFYQCRHTFITTLYRNGVDIKTIQDIVGQKIDATTLGYVISSEKAMADAMDF